MADEELAPDQAEIAGLRLRFEVDGEIVKVTDTDTATFVGNAYAFTRPDGPLLYPNWAYREQLGESAADPRGSDARDQIARHAKEVRNGQKKEV